jgi:Sap, sulfolipid-1-addressing protein
VFEAAASTTPAPAHLVLSILLYALVSASSPVALGTTLVVLTHGRGRVNGTAFAIGFIAGQLVFFLIAFSLGALSVPGGNHPTLIAGFTIAFGAALLVTAVHVRRHRNEPVKVRGPSPRMDALRARLGRLKPLSALGVGTALGIGGPKRITITIVASASIASAGLSHSSAVGLAILYVAVATSLVWVPVLLYVMWGPRAAGWLASAQGWIATHKTPLTFYPSAVLGLGLVIGGVIQLVG